MCFMVSERLIYLVVVFRLDNTSVWAHVCPIHEWQAMHVHIAALQHFPWVGVCVPCTGVIMAALSCVFVLVLQAVSNLNTDAVYGFVTDICIHECTRNQQATTTVNYIRTHI